ncbi:hypothetical protein H6F89_30435 [Cyanobacteria bacterium FACHB-63]|nr:hypothetical protein [Cyanobacteria bacterium FACHB-63]
MNTPLILAQSQELENRSHSAKCPGCGSTSIGVAPGTGPHFAKLVCLNCDRWIKWLSKADPIAQQLIAGEVR